MTTRSVDHIVSLLVGKSLEEAKAALEEYAKTNPEWEPVFLSTRAKENLCKERLTVKLDENGYVTHVLGLG